MGRGEVVLALADLRYGELTIAVYSDDAKRMGASTARGRVAFDLVLDEVERSSLPCTSVRGNWSGTSVNLGEFRRARRAGASMEVEARATWTGRMAQRRGFTRVATVAEAESRVEVVFMREVTDGEP